METNDIRDQFVTLRAKGMSYDKIAKEIGKAKQTLVDWGKELSEEIASRKALELDALYEKHFLTVQSRIDSFGEILGLIKKEIAQRTPAEWKEVPTEKLVELFLKYHQVTKEEYVEPVFKTSQEIREEKAERLLLDDFTVDEAVEEISKKLKAV